MLKINTFTNEEYLKELSKNLSNIEYDKDIMVILSSDFKAYKIKDIQIRDGFGAIGYAIGNDGEEFLAYLSTTGQLVSFKNGESIWR